MSFRDDRDALLARADAADAEAERLRDDNERLRRDLERAKQAPPPPERRRDPTPRPALAPADPDDQVPPGTTLMTPEALAEHALTSTGAEWGAAILVGLGAAVGGILGEKVLGGSWMVLVGVASGGGAGLLLGLMMMGASRDGQRRWLHRLSLPIDHVGYKELLGVGRVRRRITLHVWVSSMPEHRRAGVVDAIRAVFPETFVRWDGDRLELLSPTLDTWRRNKYAAGFNNMPVHRWFRHVVDRALLPALEGRKVERAEIA